MKLYGHEYNVFSRSYLCFGANEAFNRYVMMLLSEQVGIASVRSIFLLQTQDLVSNIPKEKSEF